MSFQELQQRAYALYRPVFVLEDIISRSERRRVEGLLDALLMGTFMISAALGILGKLGTIPALNVAGAVGHKGFGVFLIIFSVRFCFTLAEAFYRSYYYHGLELILKEALPNAPHAVSYEVSYIIYHTPPSDILLGFLYSEYGQEVLIRCGIDDAEFSAFATARATPLPTSQVMFDTEGHITLPVYAKVLYANDPEFARFLTLHDIRASEFEGAAAWVMRMHREQRKRERWWSRDVLGRVPGLGKSIAYGQVYFLEQYGHEMKDDPIYPSAVVSTRLENDEVEEMEAILTRSRQANVLLVGQAGSGRRERIAQLAHKIEEGTAFPQIEHKNIFLLDANAILDAKKAKGAFEEEFRKVLNQAVAAGNIIVVFENLPMLVQSAHALESDFIGFLQPYFDSPSIQIIATAEPDDFHKVLEPNSILMQYFDVVQMQDTDAASATLMLEQTAARVERYSSTIITYPALIAVAESAERYFPDGVMPDKAIDLLTEIAPLVESRGELFVTRNAVIDMVRTKTGIPIGAVTKEEQQKYLGLEDVMKKRVVGQSEALIAIANAMRRSRAGINNPNRPIGSFLFLGPTGVGKTETAKALAESVFNDERAMLRLDMSEYKEADALSRLIGSLETEQPGHLASMLREKQYAVLLLDEFEKTTSDVQNLFLQILDEGEFSDVHGRKVSARNTLIIATSNAAADKIWEWFNAGQDIYTQKKTLIDEIINRSIFRPELLNRFDDIVLFHPLTAEDLHTIAGFKLGALGKRLKDKGVALMITPTLVDAVTKAGFDPMFGARPMNRAIQDHVEQFIADRMLKGEIKQGDTVEFEEHDLQFVPAAGTVVK